MVRAGVVERPRQGPFTGYHEITSPPESCRLINREKLLQFLEGTDQCTLVRDHPSWSMMHDGCGEQTGAGLDKQHCRGARPFVERIQAKPGCKAVGGRIIENGKSPGSVLRETPDASVPIMGAKTGSQGRITVCPGTYHSKIQWIDSFRPWKSLKKSAPSSREPSGAEHVFSGASRLGDKAASDSRPACFRGARCPELRIDLPTLVFCSSRIRFNLAASLRL